MFWCQCSGLVMDLEYYFILWVFIGVGRSSERVTGCDFFWWGIDVSPTRLLRPKIEHLFVNYPQCLCQTFVYFWMSYSMKTWHSFLYIQSVKYKIFTLISVCFYRYIHINLSCRSCCSCICKAFLLYTVSAPASGSFCKVFLLDRGVK